MHAKPNAESDRWNLDRALALYSNCVESLLGVARDMSLNAVECAENLFELRVRLNWGLAIRC